MSQKLIHIVVILILQFQYLLCRWSDNDTHTYPKGYVYEDLENFLKELEEEFPFISQKGDVIEFRKEYNGNMYSRKHKDPTPDYWDWRDRDMVSPIKDQGRCAACWAFSAVGTLESHVAIYTDNKIVMSEQFLIDCIHDGGRYPHCSNYSPLKAFGKMVADFGGILRINDYRPYNANYQSCGYSKPPPSPVPIIGFVRVQSNEDEMVRQLYRQGPLSAGINAKSMDVYKGNNEIDEPTEQQCSSNPKDMNHAVTIVGYNIYVDNHRKVPYWIIKNSWGENWGSNGYYYLVRGRNACGIANDVSFPIVGR